MIIAAVSSMAVVRPNVRRKPVPALVSDDLFPIAVVPTGRTSALDHAFEQERAFAVAHEPLPDDMAAPVAI